MLQTTSNTSNGTTTTTDTITFDGYTETSITSGTTTTIKYYSLNGQKVAMHWNGGLYYLLSDSLGSSTVALKDDGTTQAAQLFAPYGAVRHSSGTMPTTYNFTGQRLDSQTGLLYYNFRYFDPVSGRFVRADTVQNNAGGMDPYAYVGDSPENGTDPTGRDFIPLWWLIAGAGATGIGIEVLAGTSLIILYAPPATYGANYPANGPQPSPAPTPDESPTPTPQTDTNGGMCRAGGCYDLPGVEGFTYTHINVDGSTHLYTAHTIAEHVNVSDATARLKTTLSNTAGGKGVLSVFNNLNDAEWAVQYALDHPSVPLSSIIPGTSTTFSVDTGVNIGWGYQRGNPNKVTDITSVTVWVYVTPDGQLVVMDAFPTLSKYSPPPPPPPAPPTQPTHGYAP